MNTEWLKSWRTSAAGIGMILSGLAAFFLGISGQQETDVAMAFASITTGLGLLAAGDARRQR